MTGFVAHQKRHMIKLSSRAALEKRHHDAEELLRRRRVMQREEAEKKFVEQKRAETAGTQG